MTAERGAVAVQRVAFPVVAATAVTPGWMARPNVSVTAARFGHPPDARGEPVARSASIPSASQSAPPPGLAPSLEALEAQIRAKVEAELAAQRNDLAVRMRQVEAERTALETEKQFFAEAAVALVNARFASQDDVEGALLTLAVEIASAIVGASLERDAELHRRMAEAALALLDEATSATLRCSRESHAVLTGILGESVIRVRQVEVPIVIDASIEGFGCVAESGGARVDARVGERLRAVREAFEAERLSARVEIDPSPDSGVDA